MRFVPPRLLQAIRRQFPHGGMFALLLAGLAGLEAMATEPASAVAAYSGGTCRLVTRKVKQDPWPDGRGLWSFSGEFQLEFPGSLPPVHWPLLPKDLFVIVRQNPLLAAHAPGEKTNLAKQPHYGVTTGTSGYVIVANLLYKKPLTQIEGVELELELVKVTEWEPVTFQIGMGRSDELKCGPFELIATGEKRAVRVEARSDLTLRAEHEAYLRRMPLPFLDQNYAPMAVKLVDAAGRVPVGQDFAGTVGGPVWESVGTTTYVSWYSESLSPKEGDVSYPVVLTVKMPKRYETEKLRFHFDRIELPMAPE